MSAPARPLRVFVLRGVRLGIGLLVLASVVTPHGTAPAVARGTPPEADPPNLLFVLTDDQRADTMHVMPDTVASFNVAFSNAFVSTPLCCPSRASYLTGKYAHNTGVFTNDGYPMFQRIEGDSLGPWLQARGYYTGFMGKYLNRYGVDDPVPPGWDEFYGYIAEREESGGGNGYTKALVRERWRDGRRLREKLVRYPNPSTPNFYFTRWLGDRALRFLQRASSARYNPTRKPWALLIWTKAPHTPMVPEPRYANARVPKWKPPPSYLEPDMRDKPEVEVRRSPAREDDPARHRHLRDNQLRLLMSVDDLVGRVFADLDRRGLRGSTWGVYASDNGFFLGEHHLSHKLLAYEEAARVPFRLAVPGGGRRSISALVSNIDVAPTLMELAGDPNGHAFRGRSLLPLIQGTATGWPGRILIEAQSYYYRYAAVRTHEYKFIQWDESTSRELYHLPSDPYELDNIALERPDLVAHFTAVLAQLRAR